MIVGANGQLGTALQATAPEGTDVTAHGSASLDITNRDAVMHAAEVAKPDVIVNAAAYTAVDRAETDEAAALAVNAIAVGHLAQAARDADARLVHVSTDFVFDGRAGTPYQTDAAPAPLSAYGRTKLAGERAAGADALIVRTSWVYAPTGGNFVRTMLRLMADRPEVRVVADQIGAPTWAPDLARALWALAAGDHVGLFHCTDSGVASWYDFAVAIAEEAATAGVLSEAPRVVPIATGDYPTAAQRPSYSVLDTSATRDALGRTAPHWRSNLRVMLTGIRAHG